MDLLLLTHPGLEALAAEEAAELAPGAHGAPAGSDLPGRLRVRAPTELDWRRLRLVGRAARWVAELAAGDLDELRRAVDGVDLPELDEAESFRVTAHGGAEDGLDARAAARAVGGVLHRRHGVSVDLRGFEVEVRLDLGRERCWLAVELHREPLDARIRRPRPLRSALKPTVAAALVRLAGLPGGAGSLLDPTCGSGTVLVEALAAAPRARVFGSDWDAETLEIAAGTLELAGCEAELRRVDARELGLGWGRRFEAVAMNPPWGLRVGRRARIDRLYAEILASALEVVEDGARLVVLSPRLRAVEGAAAEVGLRTAEAWPLEMGGLRPVATVLAAT